MFQVQERFLEVTSSGAESRFQVQERFLEGEQVAEGMVRFYSWGPEVLQLGT